MKTTPSEYLLLASPESAFVDELWPHLEKGGFIPHRAVTGKEAQAQLYKNDYQLAILNLELANYSAVEVLKYIKLSKQNIKILLFVANKERLSELELDENKLKKLGILGTLHPEQGIPKIMDKIAQLSHSTSWRKVQKGEKVSESKECKVLDRDLTRIPILEALGSNIAVFDHFIRLAPNKYVKVVHQGEPYPVEVLRNYANQGCEFLYFLTRDRAAYINYMNELSQKLVSSSKTPVAFAFKAVKNTTEKYLEEVHTQGVKPELVEEGKKICQNLHQLTSKDENLRTILSSMETIDPEAYSHSFLVTFYSVVICKNVSWVGQRALDTIAMGCLLHDIGQLNLPPQVREKRGKDLNPKELELYRQHPKLGAEMLQHNTLINEQVRQIIYQHHECVNGTGYPNNLTGLKIYPLAKIVALADAFTDLLVETRSPPKLAMKAFLQDREHVTKYDPNLIRALVLGLI